MSTAAPEQISETKRTAPDVATPETAKKAKLAEFDPTFGQKLKEDMTKDSKEKEAECNEEEANDSAENSAEDEEESDSNEDDDEEDTSDVLEGLITLFKEKNGREPTEDEIKMWLDTLKEASGGLAAEISADKEEEEDDEDEDSSSEGEPKAGNK